MLAADLEAGRVPAIVSTGTPIHRASHVVVPPLYGVGSRAMSTRSNRPRYSLTGRNGANSTRETAMPAATDLARKLWLAAPSATPATSNRACGRACNSRDHRRSVLDDSLALWVKEPN